MNDKNLRILLNIDVTRYMASPKTDIDYAFAHELGYIIRRTKNDS